MPTILSRFDMIFIVKDEHNEAKDMVRFERNVHVDSIELKATIFLILLIMLL